MTYFHVISCVVKWSIRRVTNLLIYPTPPWFLRCIRIRTFYLKDEIQFVHCICIENGDDHEWCDSMIIILCFISRSQWIIEQLSTFLDVVPRRRRENFHPGKNETIQLRPHGVLVCGCTQWKPEVKIQSTTNMGQWNPDTYNNSRSKATLENSLPPERYT